jgi:hypothetical protein
VAAGKQLYDEMGCFQCHGVIVRMGEFYNVGKVGDLYGNQATANWHPRQCAKGMTFHRIV